MIALRQLLLLCLLLILGINTVSCNPSTSLRRKRTGGSEISKGKKCYLPDTSSTKFSWNLCSNFDNCTAVPQFTLVDDSSVLFVNCQDGFSRELDNNIYVVNCDDGVWQPDNIFCRPIRYCEPLKSITVKAKCQKDGTEVDCEKDVRAGTTAKFECKYGYKSKEKSFEDLEIACRETGEWTSSIPQCTYECGTVLKSSTELLREDSISISDHAWFAAIYLKKKNSSFEYACSGTLITPSVVISAGHCFYDRVARDRISAESFIVGLDKKRMELNHSDDRTAQILDIESIHVSPLFEGANLRYFADLAVLKLKYAAILSPTVIPACIDFDKKISPNSSTIGKSFAFVPLRFRKRNSTDLIKAEEPYVSYEDCYARMNRENRQEFITRDKFCAFNKDRNSSDVQVGFSGAAFVSEFDGKHYVLGVLSTLLNNYIATVTDLKYTYHQQLIKDLLE